MGADLYRKNDDNEWVHAYRDSYGPGDAMLWYLGLSWWQSLTGVNQNDAAAVLAFERDFLARIHAAAEVKFGPDKMAHMRAYIEEQQVRNPMGGERQAACRGAHQGG